MNMREKYDFLKQLLDVLTKENPGRAFVTELKYDNFQGEGRESLYFYVSATEKYGYVILDFQQDLSTILSKINLFIPKPKEDEEC